MLKWYILCYSVYWSMHLTRTFFFVPDNSTNFPFTFTNVNSKLFTLDVTPPFHGENFTDRRSYTTDLKVTLELTEKNFTKLTEFDLSTPSYSILNTTGAGLLTSNGVFNGSSDFHADSEMNMVLQAYVYYCGIDHLCNSTQIFEKIAFFANDSKDCGPCTCDDRCLIEKSQQCCVDIYPKLDPPTPESSLTQCEVLIVPVTEHTPVSQLQPRALINRCPDNAFDSMPNVAWQCEQDYLSLLLSSQPENAIPVTNRSDHMKHFKNVYCALCHGLKKSNLVFWQIQIISQYPDFPSNEVYDLDSYLRELKAMLYKDLFFVQFAPPEIVPNESVDCIINTCNVSGAWLYYDETTEKSCRLFSHGYRDKFSNVFCLICNGFHGGGIFGPIFPFTVLIDMNTMESVVEQQSEQPTDSTCSSGWMFDPLHKTCRQTWCSRMFIQVDRDCITAVDDTLGFKTKTTVFFEMATPVQLASSEFFWDNMNSSLTAITEDTIEAINTTTGYELEIEYTDMYLYVNASYINRPNKRSPQIQLNNVEVTHFMFVLTTKLHKKQVPSSRTLKHLVDSLTKLKQCDTYHTIFNNQISCSSEQEYSFLYTSHTVYDSERDDINWQILRLLPKYFSESHSIKIQTNDTKQLSTPEYDLSYQVAITSANFLFDWYNPVPFANLDVEQSHTCLKFRFFSSEYTLSTAGVHFLYANKTIPYKYISMTIPFNRIDICVETYKALVVDQSSLIGPEKSSSSKTYILSLACYGASILSLFITITYHGFTWDMQTVPCWMMILLCVTLLLAQLIAILIETLQSHLSTLLCKVLGLSLHFTYLTYLFWINVIIYHLYRSFSQHTQHSRPNPVSLWYIVYVYSSATLFLMINIVHQLITGQFEDKGYSETFCYFNTTVMMIITMLLPMLTVLFANIVMVSLVIIRSDRFFDITIFQRSNRKFILNFLNLSILSGLTCLFEHVYHWTKLDVLYHVSTFLNASQGLFIFLVFICRQRVLNFMKKASFSDFVE